ncbi:MAG: hypothetical protein ACN4GR_14535 [Arenicellales bacterium]
MMPRINEAEAFGALYKSNTALLTFRLIAVVGLFVLLDHGYRYLTHLDESYLHEPVLLFAFFKQQGWLLSGLMLLLAISGLRYGRFWINWREIDSGLEIRNFITLLGGVLGLAFAIQGYNYYFNQGYYPDRLLLLLLIPLIYWRPVFVFPLLALLLLLIWQWNAPLGGYIWGTIHHASQVLILFSAWLVVNAFNRHQTSTDFVFLTCCLTASVYWAPGFLKFNMDWLTHDRIHYMPLAAYSHGWLTFLNPQQLLAYANAIIPAEKTLHIIVLGFELGALVSLWRRKLFLALLIIALTFHFGVFAAYGYMMWAWITLDIGLLLLILRMRSSSALFTPARFVLSILLILVSEWWLNPPRLAWYNTPLNYTYRYLATGDSGEQYNLSPRFFAPYGDIMTMANFRYISPGPRLVGPYGISHNKEMAGKLRTAESADDIFALEESSGKNAYKEDKAEIFYTFIRNYLSHYNNASQSGRRWSDINCCKPPPNFWSLVPDKAYTGQEPVKKLTITETTTFYSNGELKDIRQLDLKTIDIP